MSSQNKLARLGSSISTSRYHRDKQACNQR